MGNSVGIAILGGGTVGSGVVNILHQQRELLRQRTGLKLVIRHIVVRDLTKARSYAEGVEPHSNALAAIDDPQTDIVLELIGGTTTAYDLTRLALEKGKPVVTANKSLLAAKGAELFALARQHNTAIAFEASCGGGIPIIDALCRGLIGNRIDGLVGILNGTCNVILTRMTRDGMSYADALAEAQTAGFAEADPTLDVSGRDAGQKLAILASLAFNAAVPEDAVLCEGVDTLDAVDISMARQMGYVIKLLATAVRHESQLSLRVRPTLVPAGSVLADVSGPFNAVSVWGHAVGHTLFYGRGAGAMPTASAVVADTVAVALGTATLQFQQLRIFPDTSPPADVLPTEQLRSRFYLRLGAKDIPGVMGDVAAALGRNGISLSSVLQHEVSEDGDMPSVPIVITTHLAREGSVRAAIKEIDTMPNVLVPTTCLPILELPSEFGD